MTSTAILHPAFEFKERTPDLKLMTSEEMQDVDGGGLFGAIAGAWAGASWGGKVGFLVGGLVGAAVGAAIFGGIAYAITH